MSSVSISPQTSEAETLSQDLTSIKTGERLALLAERYGDRVVATSSFGLQAAVMLHLIKVHAPQIPVVFIDTGYLFGETYQYAQALQERLGIETLVYNSRYTPARQESLYGKLWEQGAEGLEHYSRINKVEPMNRALQELGADVWISGLRRSQSKTRTSRAFAEQQSKTMKVYPILDWGDGAVERYLTEHDLPRHPLASKGYVTMGDWHSTRPPSGEESAEDTRFNGEKYECGLHLDSGVNDFQI